MPIDAGSIKWDAPDPKGIVWDDAKPEPSFMARVGQHAGNLAAGAVRGAGSIGATLIRPFESGAENDARRKSIDAFLQNLGAEPDSMVYGAGKLGAEVAGTMGVGGVLANGARVLGAAPGVVNALATGGMRAGTAAPGIGGFAANQALRAGAGGAVGGASVAMVNPSDASIGVGIGMATPGALQIAGKIGGAVYNAVKGGAPNAGKLLAEALGVSEAELPTIIRAANTAPAELVPGSKLTFAQAVQQQGVKNPAVNMLERIVSEGPGGNALLKRYADQGVARMEALKAQGAQTYQGAVKEEATKVGDKIGAVLRTQKGDAAEADRIAWEALHGRATNEGTALHLPLDEMDAAMGPLGAGSVKRGGDARAVLNEANAIGTMELPAVSFGKGGGKQESLLDAVKRAGGINQNTISSKALGGEVKDLRQAGIGRAVYKDRGISLDRMTEKMHEAGFLSDPDPAQLLDLLRNDARTTFSRGANMDSTYRAAAEHAAGDAPGAERLAIPVPFDQFQRLRSSSRELGANPNIGATEAGVLNRFEGVLAGRADDAAAGNLRSGEVMTPEFMRQYNAARDATRKFHQDFGQPNNIGSIVDKPIGQDYRLTGDEITNKLWHNGAGLAGDVNALKNVLSANNYEPTMNALRGHVMTEAAGKTTAAGNFGAALPKYVEDRMPGLREAMTPDQLNALSSVAGDIRNADAAAAIGIRGSDTNAKMTRALDAGLLDSGAAKVAARVLSLKMGLGEGARSKLAEGVIAYKGKTLAALLADPRAAAAALNDAAFVRTLDAPSVSRLSVVASRGVPLLATGRSTQE